LILKTSYQEVEYRNTGFRQGPELLEAGLSVRLMVSFSPRIVTIRTRSHLLIWQMKEELELMDNELKEQEDLTMDLV
jgi:hypothetical protein